MEISINQWDDHHLRAVMELGFKLAGNIETLFVVKTNSELYILLATKRPVMESKIRNILGGGEILIDTIRRVTIEKKKQELMEDTEMEILINI